jgi:hypothetical protein
MRQTIAVIASCGEDELAMKYNDRSFLVGPNERFLGEVWLWRGAVLSQE